MTAADGAIIVAAVGVLGTLLAPLISSWVATRTKQQEFEIHRRDKADERQWSDSREAFVERRNCYIALNKVARDYHAALRAKSHIIETPSPDAHPRDTLIDARREYQFRYAETQMIVPDRILSTASQVNSILSNAYGMLMRIDEDIAEADETPAAVRSLLDTVMEPLESLRAAMRADLGVSDRGAQVPQAPQAPR